MYSLKVGRSKTGLPTLCESGGGMTNTGSAVVICGTNGEKVKPLFVPRGYANSDHAIFVVCPGMHVVEAYHDRGGERITVYRIDAIGVEDDADSVKFHEVASWENGDGNLGDAFEAAATAALQKSYCYHCREAHYIEVIA